jgi:hypothetical protein
MGVSAPAAQKANGLSTVFNVLTAPGEAFETLRISPMWGWAFLVTVALAMIGQYLATPAAIHAVQASWPAQVAANPRIGAMTAEQQQTALNMALTGVKFAWLFMPVFVLVGALIQSAIMLIFSAAGKGSASFKLLWCASMNTLVVGMGVYALVAGLIAIVRGAASYTSATAAMKAIPGLAWLAPHASIKLIAFLSVFNVVSIWGAVLVYIAMQAVARTSKINAAACAVTVIALSGAYFAVTAR